jgi:flagellar protein FlgJ
VAFARGLQKAGYATDPHYAAKVASIIKHSLA